ncbi:MAG: hypothetical protein MUO40_13940 [Anaerolineaceae bacterium]|nr:hypothetical protein [Anaerolineaceae bacterium]
MIIFSDGFFDELSENRTCYIGGRKGSGKSLLAIEIAERYLKRGWYLVSNMATPWNDEFNTVPTEKNVLGILDEGGVYTRTYNTVSGFTEFSRKTRSIVMFVGRREPHEELCDFAVYPFWDMHKNLRIPLKIWRWYVYQKRKSYSGTILQTGWQNYYGIYSSEDPGDYPIHLLAFFEKRAKDLFERYGRTYKIQDVGSKSDIQGQNNADFARDMASMAQKIRDDLSSSKRKTSGRFKR